MIRSNTPAYKQIMESDCGEVLFSKYEQLPSFKISKEAFEDSMTVYLKANNAFDPTMKFQGQFILTKKSQILDFGRFRGSVPPSHFQAGLLRFSKLWLPARNNDVEICAIVRTEFEVKDDRLIVTLVQAK